MSKITKKTKKWDRNSAFCTSYKNSNRRERNKIVALERHLKKFPDDVNAKAAIDTCKKVIRGF